jgi:HEAT repeat protein
MRIAPSGSPDEWFSWLTGSDRALRKRASLIIGGLEPTDDVALEPFVARLRGPDDDVVFWAVVGLARLGPRVLAALSEICHVAVTHSAFGVRQEAVSALSRIGPEDPRAVATLRIALRDASPFVRRQALQAMIRVPQLEPTDIVLIASMADDSDETVASWSEIALRNIKLRKVELS